MDNSQKLETQVLINRRVMNKWRYIRIVEYSEMKETYNTHNNMDESWLCTFNAKRMGLRPGQGTKSLQDVQHVQENKKKSHIYTYMHACDDAAAAKSLQLCPTLCNPINSSPPGSAVPGIL